MEVNCSMLLGRQEKKLSHQTCNGWLAAYSSFLRQNASSLLVERMLVSVDLQCTLDSGLGAQHALTGNALLAVWCFTGSQWSWRRAGVMWLHASSDLMSIAASFWTPCRERSTTAVGSQYGIAIVQPAKYESRNQSSSNICTEQPSDLL